MFIKKLKTLVRAGLLAIPGILCLTGVAGASEAEGYASVSGIDTFWVLMAAFMVFIMQAGFGMLEAGLIRTKNTCNVLMNNFLDFCMASMGFFMFGYAIMFGTGNGFMGLNGWFLMGATHEGTIPLEAAWLFHAVFCGAAATIVAGGVAERIINFVYKPYYTVGDKWGAVDRGIVYRRNGRGLVEGKHSDEYIEMYNKARALVWREDRKTRWKNGGSTK